MKTRTKLLFTVVLLGVLVAGGAAADAEVTTYVYYVFGDDCPASGCQYVCQTPDCSEYVNEAQDVPVVSSGVDLEIMEATHPARVRAGDTVSFDITVRNQGDQPAQNVELALQAYGQVKRVEHLHVASGTQRTFTVNFTVPQAASGPESVELQATEVGAGGGTIERDVASMTLQTEELHVTLQLVPERVVVGEPVTVQGMMSTAGARADLYVGGFYVTTVTADETRHYTNTIIPDEPGVFRVELHGGNTRKTAFLRVDPRLGITGLNVPETVNTQDRFQACATVFKDTRDQVTLTALVDDTVVQEGTFVLEGEDEKCMDLAIGAEGTHTITFRITGGSTTAELAQDVRVVESRIEVNVFPQEITLQEQHAGLFQVEIANRDASPRTFTVGVAGLEQIAEITQPTVSLGSGDKRTVFVRVVPPTTGVFTGNVTVTADGRTYAEAPVRILSSTNPPLKGPLDRAGAAARDVVRSVQNNAAAIGVALLVVLGLGAAAVILYRRARRRGVIEPRY